MSQKNTQDKGSTMVQLYKELSGESKDSLARWRLILGKKAEDQGVNFNQDKQGVTQSQTNPGQPQKGQGSSQGQPQKGQGSSQGQPQQQTEGQPGGEGELPQESSEDEPNSRISQAESRDMEKMDDTLNFVYHPPEERSAGLGPSRLSIPKWIENVKELFPNNAKEVLENDFISKSEIADLIKHPELFEKVEPSIEMVKTIISLKHMLPEDVKQVARKIVKKVVDQLKDRFKSKAEKHIIGAIRRDMHTPVKVFRNIDWKQSIQKNLKHYDPNLKKLIMAEPRFFSNQRKKKPWHIIVLVDESGSMTDSVIYSIVMASIFSSLPAVHTNLIIFDTQVVDLSDHLSDPVDILMNVQLGGGTDITKAVRYGQGLIKKPKKTIMVIISDFYEGRNYNVLTQAIRNVLEGGSRVLGIAALGYNAQPFYDKRYAKELNKIGVDVIASTPDSLPEIIAKLMRK